MNKKKLALYNYLMNNSAYWFFNGGSGAWYGEAPLNGVPPTFVSQFSQNRYYDTSRGETSFPYTFTRASNATMFDSAGNLVWAPANMCLQSGDMTQAVWTKTDCTATLPGGLAPSGANVNLVTEGVAGTAIIQQNFSGLPSYGALNISKELKKGNIDWVRLYFGTGAGNFQVWFNLATGAVGTTLTTGTAQAPESATITDLGDGWYRATISIREVNSTSILIGTISAPADNNTARVNNATHYEGNTQLEMWSPTAKSSPMIITGATAIYRQRLDYDPSTSLPRGLLVETVRTNSLLNSAMTGGVAPSTQPTSWNITAVGGITITYAYGYENGIRYIDVTYSGTNTTGAGAFPSIFLGAPAGSIVAANGQTWTGSVYARKIAGADSIGSYALQMRGRDAGSTLIGGQSASVSVATGGASLNTSRNTVSFTFSSASVAFAELILVRTLAIGEAVDITLRIGGSQFEQGFAETSHIPTYSIAATRSPETCTLSTTGWMTSSAGAFYASYTKPVRDTGAQAYGVATTDGNARWVYAISGINRSYDGVNLMSGSAYASNVEQRVVMGLIGGNQRMSVNGGAVTTVAYDGTMTPDATLEVGTVSGASQLNGWIKELRYYPSTTGVSDAQLQALTA